MKLREGKRSSTSTWGHWRVALAGLATTLNIAGIAAMTGCGSERPNAADLGGFSSSGAGGGPCSPEGAVSPCHEKIGQHGDIVTCIDGERFCFGGKWSQCMQKSGGIRSVQVKPASAGIHPQAIAPAGTSCVDMPCDPYCQDSTVPGPFESNGGGGTVVGVSGGFIANSNIPGNCSSTNGGATAYSCSGFKAKTTDPDGVCSECDQYNVPLNGSVTLQQCQSACQSDQHCTGDGTDSCTAFSAGQNSWCNGVDVTVPIGCQAANGDETISVCNRGSVDITVPVECCQFSGNSAHFADDLQATAASCAGGTYLGSTTGTIAKGTCQQLVINPGGNTSSIICNPHYNSTGTSTTTAATYPSTPSGDSGGWTTVQNTFTNNATDTSALLGRQIVTSTFDNNYTNGTPGWTNPANAQATTTNNVYMTAAVTVPAGTVGTYKLPTTNSAVTATGWTNAANAQSDTDGSAVATNGAASATVYAGGQSTTNGSGAGAVAWTNAANATGTSTSAIGAAGATSTEALNWPGKNSSSTMTLSGYGALPTLTALTVTARLADNNATDRCTVQIDLVDNAGTNVLGATHLYNATIASNTFVDKAYALTAANLTTVNANATFLADPRVKITITPPNGNPAENRVYIDSVKFDYSFAPVQAYGNFSFGVPAGATVTQIDWEARIRNTAPVAGTSYIKLQGYTGSTAVGTAKNFTTATTPALTNTLTVRNWSDTGLSLTDAQVANGTFTVRVDAGGGGTAEVEYIKARVTYVTGATNTITLKNFNINVPTGATITSVVTNVNWKTDVATGTLGIQPYVGGVAIGSETTAAGSTIAAPATNTYTGAITAAQLANGSFDVRLRASGTSTNFTASVDFVSVTVTYQITSASVDLGNFGFNIPAGATVTGVTVNLKEKVSSGTPTSAIQAEAFRGATSTGAVASDTNPGTGYSTVSGNGTSFGVPADYANGTFVVRLTATTPSTTTTSFNAYVDYVNVTITYTTGAVAMGVAECDEYNNWAAYKNGNSCVNMVVGGSYVENVLTYEYTPTCAPNQRLQWGYLAYDGATPSANGSTSTIKFEASTQDLSPTVQPATAYQTVAYTGAPNNNPSVCPFTGVTGCPIDLFTALGDPNAYAEKLTLKITLTPSCDVAASPCTGTATPTLNSWQVTYSCVDAE